MRAKHGTKTKAPVSSFKYGGNDDLKADLGSQLLEEKNIF